GEIVVLFDDDDRYALLLEQGGPRLRASPLRGGLGFDCGGHVSDPGGAGSSMAGGARSLGARRRRAARKISTVDASAAAGKAGRVGRIATGAPPSPPGERRGSPPARHPPPRGGAARGAGCRRPR